MKKKLLLHTCCAPCSTHCVKELLADYDVVMYFYNPNVHPYGEYIRRLGDAQKVGDKLGVELVEGDYDVDDWLGHIAGFEEEPEGGKRCGICFSIRLKRTAEYAKKNGFDCFTTTLSISPHKNSDVINSLGEELAKKHGVSWVHSDFKKKDGFKRSSEMSKKIGLYRQKYCGCFYSVKI
jgi:predicted adenine nucleotide alpha hydrolase (AANH) superfamily ATPase